MIQILKIQFVWGPINILLVLDQDFAPPWHPRVVIEVQHTHQGLVQVEEHVFQDFCTLSCNYMLKG